MKNGLLLAALLTLTSLTLAQPAKLDRLHAKRIAEGTPPGLSQIPTDNRPGTDARDANLKGKVKSVAYRRSDGAQAKSSRQVLITEDHYNEIGNRVRSIDWDHGRPIGVTVYGYVDNMRVSRTKEIVYPAGTFPAPQGCTPLEPTLRSEAVLAKLDTRYHLRWVYKYDNSGRLIEDQRVGSSGTIATRSVYSYEGPTRRAVLHYAGPTSNPFYRVIEISDPAHGNIVEEWLHHEDQEAHAVRYYRYKFDENGNWIEQRVTERSVFNDGPPKLIETTYRTITYYP